MRNIDLGDIKQGLRKANYFWLVLTLVLALISHYSRAARWVMLIEPLGYRLKVTHAFYAVMIGYLVNFFLPRVGEVVKCGVIYKSDKIPLNKLLGTMVIERGIDLICLVGLAIIIIFIQFDLLENFLEKNVHFNLADKIPSDFFGWMILIVSIIGTIILLFIIFSQLKSRFRDHSTYIKLRKVVGGFVHGLKSVSQLKNYKGFLFHTLVIWVMYYLITYFFFFCIRRNTIPGSRSWL